MKRTHTYVHTDLIIHHISLVVLFLEEEIKLIMIFLFATMLIILFIDVLQPRSIASVLVSGWP